MRPWFPLLLCGLLATPAASQNPQQLLREYLRLDTQNPPGREHLAAEFLASALRREGLASRLLVTPEGRTTLYAKLEATDPAAEVIVLLHHMDIVAPGPGWSQDPFGGDIREARMFGRGAIDAKSLGVAHLAAFLDLARRRKPLRRGVILLAVADEEAGGAQGVGFLLREHPELLTGVTAVLNEGGANRVIGDRLLWWGIETAQKRPLWLEASVSGRPGHASGYRPFSAAHKMIAALARLLERPNRWHVTPPVQRFLEELAPLHGGDLRRAMLNIGAFIAPEGPRGFLPPGMENLFLDTVQVTVLNVGERINVIPAEARAKIDIRLLPDTDDEAFLQEIRAALGPQIETTVLLRAPQSAPSPTENPVYQEMAAFLGAEGPVVPSFIYGLTDSHFFRERGIPAYGVSPFAIAGDEMRGIHAADESIPVADFEKGVARMTRMLRVLALERP